jgi:hypothetical protein
MKNKNRYPTNWKLISLQLIWNRAQNHCEVCGIMNGAIHPKTGKKQTLSVAHLDHNEANMDDSNLKVMCNYDHLNHDRANNLIRRWLRKAKII